MKSFKTSNGFEVIVDDEDFESITKYSWNARKDGNTYYARRTRRKKDNYKKLEMLLLHRVILNAPKDLSVDHINGNGLDNRKQNLRLCCHKQNSANMNRFKGVSKFKGVTLTKNKTWKASLGSLKYGTYKYLGTFSTEVEAARAYNQAAKERWGEFAKLNEC